MLNYSLAGFGNRFLAAIIDGLVASVAFWVLFIPLGMLGIFSFPSFAEMTQAEDETAALYSAAIASAAMGIGLLYAIVYVAYETFMISSPRQATLGKMALKMKVVTEAGDRLTAGQALGRSLVKMVSGNVCFLLWLWPLFNDKEQALHDLIVKDVVVRNSPNGIS